MRLLDTLLYNELLSSVMDFHSRRVIQSVDTAQLMNNEISFR